MTDATHPQSQRLRPTQLFTRPANTPFTILIQAIAIAAIVASAAFIINAIRPDGLPLIADKPYDIFVPCPETLGQVDIIEPSDPKLLDTKSFLIDARPQDDFNAWHLNGAFNITYDYLDPISPDELKNISRNIINSGKAQLIVYGDGDGEIGSTGYELGRELAGNGISHVYIVKGGADALRGIHE